MNDDGTVTEVSANARLGGGKLINVPVRDTRLVIGNKRTGEKVQLTREG